MRVAALQMTSGPDSFANLAQAHSLLMEAVEKGAELVAFPEFFNLLTPDAKQLQREAETIKGPTVETLQEWAVEYDVWILGGSIPLKTKTPKKVSNTSLMINSDGEILGRYDKIHLFDAKVKGDQVYQESKYVVAGKKHKVIPTPETKLGLSICYDLRFPELYRKLSEEGAEVIFAPSAFTQTTGRAHWDILTRARAIENQAYVICPGQTGEVYPGRQTHGHSRIIDPWGRVLAERPTGIGVVWADINLEELRKLRKEFPVLKHRKH